MYLNIFILDWFEHILGNALERPCLFFRCVWCWPNGDVGPCQEVFTWVYRTDWLAGSFHPREFWLFGSMVILRECYPVYSVYSNKLVLVG